MIKKYTKKHYYLEFYCILFGLIFKCLILGLKCTYYVAETDCSHSHEIGCYLRFDEFITRKNKGLFGCLTAVYTIYYI